jgi:hypothetical protein
MPTTLHCLYPHTGRPSCHSTAVRLTQVGEPTPASWRESAVVDAWCSCAPPAGVRRRSLRLPARGPARPDLGGPSAPAFASAPAAGCTYSSSGVPRSDLSASSSFSAKPSCTLSTRSCWRHSVGALEGPEGTAPARTTYELEERILLSSGACTSASCSLGWAALLNRTRTSCSPARIHASSCCLSTPKRAVWANGRQTKLLDPRRWLHLLEKTHTATADVDRAGAEFSSCYTFPAGWARCARGMGWRG